MLAAISFIFIGNLHAIETFTGLTKPPEPQGKYFMHTGFNFDAVLKTAVYSYNLATPVIAEVEYDIIYLGKIIIPKNTLAIGYASVYKTDDRINVFFHTLVFPNGQELKFMGMALHTDGSAGIPGKVKKATQKVPAKILFSVAGAAIPGIAGDIAGGLSQEAIKEMEQYTPDYSIEVKKDTPILIYNIQRVEY